MNSEQAIQLGNIVAVALGLKKCTGPLMVGKYKTEWGYKTPEGLGRLIHGLYNETVK